MRNLFKGHTQDGANWIFENEEQYNELLALLKHFRRKILFEEAYDARYNAISLWCDGAARGIYNSECTGVYAITYEVYHEYYLELTKQEVK